MTVTLTTAGPTCSTRLAKSGRPRTSGAAGVPPDCAELVAAVALGAAVEDCGAQAVIRVVIRTMPTRRWEATYLDIDESLQLCRGPPKGLGVEDCGDDTPTRRGSPVLAAHSVPPLPGGHRQRYESQQQHRPVAEPQGRG